MQFKKNKDGFLEGKQGITRRGESIFYIGTLFFIAGIILLILGSVSVIFFQVHYETESEIVLSIVSFIGVGLLFVALGINCMIHQWKHGTRVSILGLLFIMGSLALFLMNYQNNWYYPTISYILILYILGLILLMGNAFGNVTLLLVSSPKEQSFGPVKETKFEYTEEEIEKDIDDAVKKSLLKAADEIQFDLVDTRKLKVGNADFGSESVVKVKDDMKESYTLNMTIHPEERENWGAPGIDKISSQLADALVESPTQKKTRFINRFVRIFKS